MSAVLAALALALGWCAWTAAPWAMDRLGLGWTDEFGRLALALAALSALAKAISRATGGRFG